MVPRRADRRRRPGRRRARRDGRGHRATCARGSSIDATADAYVAASAGVEVQQGDERGRVQPASLMFRLSHVDLAATAAYARAHPDQVRTSLAPAERSGDRHDGRGRALRSLARGARRAAIVSVPRELVSFFATPYPDEVTVNMTRVVDIDPLDPDDLTRAEVEARGQVTRTARVLPPRGAGLRERARRGDGDAGRDPRVAPDRRRVHAHARRRSCRAVRSPTRSRAAPIRSTSTIRRAAGRRRTGCRPGRVTRSRIAVSFRGASTGCSSPAAASRRRTRRSPRRG